MEYSACVGEILDKREVFCKTDGELFYLASVRFGRARFPIVGSEHILGDRKGVYKIQFYIRSIRRHGRRFTHIYAVNLLETNKRVSDKCLVNIEGKVVSDPYLGISYGGIERLSFVVHYSAYNDNRTIVHCVAKEGLARRLKPLERGDNILFNGTLTRKGEALQVLVTEVRSIPEKE
jgi:hypothetical protein